MNLRVFAFLLVSGMIFSACQKNTVSKIPQIALTSFTPQYSMRVNLDTVEIQFGIIDGDADIGGDTISEIYLKDSRFDSAGFVKTPFPDIDPAAEDPKKGLQANCIFFPIPQPTPRLDSLHMATGDTFSYQLYIMDRAGHKSNIVTTHQLIIKP